MARLGFSGNRKDVRTGVLTRGTMEVHVPFFGGNIFLNDGGSLNPKNRRNFP